MMKVAAALQILGRYFLRRYWLEKVSRLDTYGFCNLANNCNRWVRFAEFDIAQIGKRHGRFQRDVLLRNISCDAQATQIEAELPSNVHLGTEN